MYDEGVEETVQQLILYCKWHKNEMGDVGCSYE